MDVPLRFRSLQAIEHGIALMSVPLRSILPSTRTGFVSPARMWSRASLGVIVGLLDIVSVPDGTDFFGRVFTLSPHAVETGIQLDRIVLVMH